MAEVPPRASAAMAEVMRRAVGLDKVVLLIRGYGDADRCCSVLQLRPMNQSRPRSLGERPVTGQALELPSRRCAWGPCRLCSSCCVCSGCVTRSHRWRASCSRGVHAWASTSAAFATGGSVEPHVTARGDSVDALVVPVSKPLAPHHSSQDCICGLEWTNANQYRHRMGYLPMHRGTRQSVQIPGLVCSIVDNSVGRQGYFQSHVKR